MSTKKSSAVNVVSACSDFVKWVDPLIGTVGEGNVFPGSCMPFGLVQPGPDSGTKIWCPGYKHTDTTIRGLSQTHLNGTGRPAMGDISLMPFVGERDDGDWSSPFRKEAQFCSPDCYSVILDRDNIKAEATCSQRVAWWRFTYPASSAKRLSLDAAAMLMQGYNIKFGQRIIDSSYKLSDDKTEITGYKYGRGWTPYKIFYSVKFDRPWTKIVRLPSDPFDGKGDRFVLDFDGNDEILVQVAISTVSEDGAVANRKAETKGQTFDTVRAANRAAWNTILSRATIVKGTEAQKKNWYTALYHMCIQPNDQTDVDGKYRGDDDAIHTAKCGFYSTLSVWDTFRAVQPFYTLLVPERTSGIIDSMLEMGRQHGHLPQWTMWQHETHGMVGIHSIAVIVDAWSKGFRDFDPNEALNLMVRSIIATDGENPTSSWTAYWENGYYPYKPGVFDLYLPKGGCVSRTLEYAYDWWCISHFSKLIGNKKGVDEMLKWAECWKNVFDTKTGFARARAPITDGGAWREPFDPRDPRCVPGEFWSDYTEANAWIVTWFVLQDPDGLAELMGGKEKTIAKLDEFFTTPPIKRRRANDANNDEGGLTADGKIVDGQIGQCWHGNEPSHHIPYFYTLMGAPEKTQKLIHDICHDCYEPTVDGLCGNDDCGQMSGWYIFSMLGFYPFNPCDDGYVFGAPQAEEMKLTLGNGKTLTVKAEGLSDKNYYVSSIKLNGKKIDGPRITHAQIVGGGELVFEMCAGK